MTLSSSIRSDTRHLVAFASPLLALSVLVALTLPAQAETSPYQPYAAQPVLPSSPVVDGLVNTKAPILEVRKAPPRVRHVSRTRHRHVAHARVPRAVDRPALAGVELLQPLQRPGQPPHIEVPVPGYPLDNFITAYTTPAPPIVCHPTRRDPDLPDPRLYRERTVTCEADNP